jgi:hypothetical protein
MDNILQAYTELSGKLSLSGYNFWYASPELWSCQDYKVLLEGNFLINEERMLLVPPLVDGNITLALNDFLRKEGQCEILFAPHDISKRIHPAVFKCFEAELVDKNYVNDTMKVHLLQGNALKKLRNNVNNFAFKDDIVAAPLDSSALPRAIELCNKYHFVSSEFDDIQYNASILANIGRFNLIHRGYWLDGELVAFNIGAPLSGTTASFLISKSKHDIKYLVDFVRWDFHNQALGEGYYQVNDGSDLDSEGLSQLKRKFAPIEIQPVYSLRWQD